MSAAAPRPQQSTAAEAVRRASLESLVTEMNPREPVRSLNDAKKQLLERVGFGSQSPAAERPQSEEERVGYLLEVLEGNYKPILTIGFFNFAAQGDWDLAYTNAAMLPIGPRLKVYEQFQRIEPGEGVKGECTNILEWRLLDEGIDGRLEVSSEYEFDPRGRMNTSLLQHRLIPDGKIPSDPEALVRILRRAMPHELFDPDAHAMETTFLDDTMRIVRLRGPKFEGRLNIFVRRRRDEDENEAGVDGVQAKSEGSESEATASDGS
eukprot:g5842.t1